MTSREIQTAVRLILPGELAKHAVSEGEPVASQPNSNVHAFDQVLTRRVLLCRYQGRHQVHFRLDSCSRGFSHPIPFGTAPNVNLVFFNTTARDKKVYTVAMYVVCKHFMGGSGSKPPDDICTCSASMLAIMFGFHYLRIVTGQVSQWDIFQPSLG